MDSSAMRGWERLLRDDAIPSSPRKRLDYFDKNAPGIDGWAATILP
jgi:hypothetical protein